MATARPTPRSPSRATRPISPISCCEARVNQTIDVYGTYIVAGNQSLHFKDVSAFDFGQVNPVEPPVLINRGTVEVVGHDDDYFATLIGVVSEFNVYKATFWNKAGGEF